MSNYPRVIINAIFPNNQDWLYEYNKNLYALDYEEVKSNPKNQNWVYISFYKDLSKEFIIEFAEYINFNYIILNKRISQDIKDYCRMFI